MPKVPRKARSHISIKSDTCDIIGVLLAEESVLLEHLISGIEKKKIIGGRNVEVTGLAYDSRKVKKGDLFFCVKGFKTDGHAFARKAQEMGAVAVVVEDSQDNIEITQVVVQSVRKAMAQISSAYYDHPTKKLKLVGITGTNGKTTASFMVESVLRAAGLKTGLLGTVEYRIGETRAQVERTTPESLDLQALFSTMVDASVDAAVIEVSSHAIDLLRVEACDFDVVVFTNLSQDHLDYHGTIDEYFRVKKRIFDSTINCATAQIINTDDEYGRLLIKEGIGRQYRYSTKDKVEVYADHIDLRPDGTDMRVLYPGGGIDVKLALPGMYNISNALAAAGAAAALGIDGKKIKEGLEALKSVPGRFERVDKGQEYTVIVDYAHTPDSLEKVLSAARQITKGRLISVFGCGGDRDKGKRPLMGRVAAEISDYTIVTSDNPRSEDPNSIIREIINGIEEVENPQYEVEVDRKLAIKKALEKAKPGDFVVVAGKGHETGQEIAGRKIPFDDVRVASELIKEIKV